jgi:Adenylate and Guanylate cyclase catalytic domain
VQALRRLRREVHGRRRLAYFGYPQAHEDDAERAVRAGLDLVAAVGALKTHASLQSRVGIATGLVVVGDLVGSGASQEQSIVGETPNLAARLQGIAEANGIVVAREAARTALESISDSGDPGGRQARGDACRRHSGRLHALYREKHVSTVRPNATFLLALIFIASPIAGLRPTTARSRQDPFTVTQSPTKNACRTSATKKPNSHNG